MFPVRIAGSMVVLRELTEADAVALHEIYGSEECQPRHARTVHARGGRAVPVNPGTARHVHAVVTCAPAQPGTRGWSRHGGKSTASAVSHRTQRVPGAVRPEESGVPRSRPGV
jgi:hypothetical protein